jgi:hypothetical protein
MRVHRAAERALSTSVPSVSASAGGDAAAAYVGERHQLLLTMTDDLQSLAEDGPDERLFAALVRATLLDDLVKDLRVMQGAIGGAGESVVAAWYRIHLVDAEQGAASAYADCVRSAEGARESVRGVGVTCDRRLEALRAGDARRE